MKEVNSTGIHRGTNLMFVGTARKSAISIKTVHKVWEHGSSGIAPI
jgi:hypothetical protein